MAVEEGKLDKKYVKCDAPNEKESRECDMGECGTDGSGGDDGASGTDQPIVD